MRFFVIISLFFFIVLIIACSETKEKQQEHSSSPEPFEVIIDNLLSYEIPEGAIPVFTGKIGTNGGDIYEGANKMNINAEIFNLFMAENKFRIVKLELQLDNYHGEEIESALKNGKIEFTVYNSTKSNLISEKRRMGNRAADIADCTGVKYIIEDIQDKDFYVETWGTYPVLEFYVKVLRFSSMSLGWRVCSLEIINIDQIMQMGMYTDN